MDWLVAPLVLLIILGSFYLIIELFVHRTERKMLIEKIESLKDVDVSKIFSQLSSSQSSVPSFSALRWGLLFIGIGLGMLVGFGINYAMFYSNGDFANGYFEYQEFIVGASVCFFGGLGLLIAYIIESKKRK